MMRVLVVDDEVYIRELLVGSLSGMGYQVDEAANGDVCLEMARRNRPDLILLDVLMPVMDGFDVLRELRKGPATKNMPVILLTSLPPDEGETVGMQLGASHYLTKPWDAGDLALSLRVALREGAASREDGGPTQDLDIPTLKPPAGAGPQGGDGLPPKVFRPSPMAVKRFKV